MPIQGFQPDASVFTAFWRYQLVNSQSQVTTEQYVNFGLVKWFKTTRAASPQVGGAIDQVFFWYNPKEQNEDPDLVLKGPAATQMLADLDNIWNSSGNSSGFQPDSAIDTAFWRWQYTNALGVITNEIYLNMGAIKWTKTLRLPVAQVSLWFNNKDQDFNADLILDPAPSAMLLSDFDAIWAN